MIEIIPHRKFREMQPIATYANIGRLCVISILHNPIIEV
jgi:hypothetical protein